ncbi:uncharacterized protein LOC143893763 [Temnothorax americanus]|uniref:uncharacterized protein LOC143893763 n=1 Tax=Temnothorax americanus TaxID=1964332 RepID=UPI004068DD36
MNTALSNTSKKKGGQRYDDTLKLFATYLFVIGGRMLYETLSANLPLPSLSTVSRTLDNSGCLIIEGDMRVTELEKFLHMRKLPFYVWLSEDATRITGRIQYDSKSNQLVGFPLPLNNDGMPVTHSFTATCAKKIEEYFSTNSPASLLYVIIAQPLVYQAPSFCLCLYSTDNKFEADDVIKRWSYTVKYLRGETRLFDPFFDNFL